MKRNKYRGFANIYSYSLKRDLANRKFVVSTIIVSLIIIIGIVAVFMLVAKPSDESEEETAELNISKVYVVDETGLGVAPYAEIAAFLEDDTAAGLEYVTSEDADKLIEDNKNKEEFAVVIQKESEPDEDSDEEVSFVLDIIHSDDVDEDALSNLGDTLSLCFKNYVVASSGLGEEELTMAMIGVGSTINEFGEHKDMSDVLFTYLGVFLVMFLVYFVICFYGQQIQADVSVEKSNKLVEQLLVSVSPEALITGKSLAMITSCIIQVVIWIGSFVLAVIGGLFLSVAVYGSNALISSDMFGVAAAEAAETASDGTYFDLAMDILANAGVSPAAVVVSVLLAIMGIVFYMALATIGGSMVTKPEEAANMQVVYIIPLIISFFAMMFPAIESMGHLPKACAFIPFTGAMYAGGGVLVGDISVTLGLVALAILILSTLICFKIAAKIYMSLIFYNGDKMPLVKKVIFLFNKKKADKK